MAVYCNIFIIFSQSSEWKLFSGFIGSSDLISLSEILLPTASQFDNVVQMCFAFHLFCFTNS